MKVFTSNTSPTSSSELFFVMRLAKSNRGGLACGPPQKTKICGS